MPRMITVYDGFCPWPFSQPYGEVQIAAPKKARRPRRRRSPILADLRSPKYKPRVVKDKKRAAKVPSYNPEK